MIYTIHNSHLKVTVDDLGAQIVSLVGEKTKTEYLWQGDAAYWAGRSPLLFPICGRLFQGKYTFLGKEYAMQIHGFVRFLPFTLTESSPTALTFSLSANEKTRAEYPFDFVFRVTYSLEGTTLKTLFTVENPGKETLPFSFGGHPGFRVPFADGEAFEDYYLLFAEKAKPRALVMTEARLYGGKTEPFALEDDCRLPLAHSLFDNDAIFLTEMCHTVSLCSVKNARKVTVKFGDMDYLGFWHKPHADAPYVCIEPWHGIPSVDGEVDDLATKAGMIRLPAGGVYSTYFDITVTE